VHVCIDGAARGADIMLHLHYDWLSSDRGLRHRAFCRRACSVASSRSSHQTFRWPSKSSRRPVSRPRWIQPRAPRLSIRRNAAPHRLPSTARPGAAVQVDGLLQGSGRVEAGRDERPLNVD